MKHGRLCEKCGNFGDECNCPTPATDDAMKPPDRELNKAAVKFAEDWAEDEGWPDSSDKAAMAKRFKQALSAAIKSQTGKP